MCAGVSVTYILTFTSTRTTHTRTYTHHAQGIWGNPIFLVLAFIGWGAYEFFNFTTNSTCSGSYFIFYYTYIANLVILTIALLLLCTYYFVRVRRKMQRRRNIRIAAKHGRGDVEYLDEDDDDLDLNGPHHLRGAGRRGDAAAAAPAAGGAGFDENGMAIQLQEAPGRRGGHRGGGPAGRGSIVMVVGPDGKLMSQAQQQPRYNANDEEREGAGSPMPHQVQQIIQAPPARDRGNINRNRRSSMPHANYYGGGNDNNGLAVANAGYGLRAPPQQAMS